MSQSQRAGPASAQPGSAEPSRPGAEPSRSGSLFAVGAAAAGVAVPLALALGMWVGTRSANTVLAVVPALLGVVLLPPLAVVGAQRWWSRRQGPGRLRLGAALGAALGVQVLMLGAAVWAGVSAHRSGHVVLLTLVEALVLPWVVTRLARRVS